MKPLLAEGHFFVNNPFSFCACACIIYAYICAQMMSVAHSKQSGGIELSKEFGTIEQKKSQLRPKRRRRKLSKRQEFVRGLDAIYIVALILTVYMLFFRVVVVVGPSMYDTLIQGDRLLLVSSLVYRQPQQGDIVVCSKDSFDNGTCFVKRVIATEGQEVNIDFETGEVFVDGELLEEEYLYSPTNREEGIEFPLTVGQGQVFVMGDNRERSLDSRSPQIGLVDERQIVGKAIFILSPGDNAGTEQAQWGRIGWIG